MFASKKIQDGGGDSLPAYKDGDHVKSDQHPGSPISTLNHYEGSQQQPPETAEESVQKEGKTCACAHAEDKPEHEGPRGDEKTVKNVPHRRLEDHRHLLQFDYPREVTHPKKNPPKQNFPTTLLDGFSDEEIMESSPLIEDKNTEVRLARQREYQQELNQQIAQREEMRQQQRARRNFRASQRSQAGAAARAAAERDSLTAVERYENQLRMEQMEEMRKQLQLQREREVQRLRRIYRKDDKKFLAHLQRLKLQDSDQYGQGKGDVTVNTQKEAASSEAYLLPPTQASESKTSESKPEVTQPKHDLPVSDADAPKTAAPRNLRPEKKEKEEVPKTVQPSSALTSRAVEKPLTNKPLTHKQAYLRLQQQRREEEMKLVEKRSKAAAWRADRAREERLEREVRNMAEWRAGHSLAGVPLVRILPAQRGQFEAAASWLEKQRATQQEQKAERDKQLVSWRDEKKNQINERRLKKKAEEKVSREMQVERRKEAEKCYDRWLYEIRARKAVERASVPRGAIGVSTYSSSYSLPSPWRQLPKQSWRGRSFRSTSLSGKGKDDVTP